MTTCRAALADEERARAAEPLARFLLALQWLAVDDELCARVPGDEIERANVQKRLPILEERVAALRPKLQDFDVEAVRDLAARLAKAPPRVEEPRLCHGDLYARHLLIDDARKLCGVIDWGDLHLGDPAGDLSIAYSFLPAAARERFFGASGDVDEAARDGARFGALFYEVVLVLYGSEIQDDPLQKSVRYALEHALDDRL